MQINFKYSLTIYFTKSLLPKSLSHSNANKLKHDLVLDVVREILFCFLYFLVSQPVPLG